MNNEEIRKKLIELSDAKYKEFHSGLCPGMDTEMLGVSIPKVRKLAKEIIKDNPAEYLKQPAEEYYEELLLQALVIANQKIELDKKKAPVQSYEQMYGKLYANDILGINYLKYSKNMTPYCIKRTNHYFDDRLEEHISSATSIRKAIQGHQDISKATPAKIENPVFL